MRLIRKLQSNRGESLVEVLAAIVVIALASLVLMNSARAATRANLAAEKADAEYRAQIEGAEDQRTELGTGNLVISSSGDSDKSVNVTFYGEAGGITSFEKSSN